MTALDVSSPGFVVTVLTNTNELRLTGRSDPQLLAKVLDGMVDVSERVLMFTFEDSERELDVLKLRVNNHDLYFLEHPAWVKGNLVRFSFGYPGRMFGPRFAVVDNIKGFRELTITCIEEAALANAAECRLFKNLTRLEVIRQMVTEGRFPGVRVIQTNILLLEGELLKQDWTQARQTDLQFLYRLAEPLGFEAYIEGDTLFFLPRPLDKSPIRSFTYFYGERGDLLDFNISDWAVTSRPAQTVSKSRDPIERVNREACGSDENTKRPTLGNQSSTLLEPTNKAGSGNVASGSAQTGVSDFLAGRTVNTSPLFNQSDLTNEANGRFRRQEQDEVKADAVIVGDPQIPAKTVIEILGISCQLSGKWYVETHIHTIQAGLVYKGKLKLLKNALGSIPTQDPPTLSKTNANENTKPVVGRRLRVVKVNPVDGRLQAVPVEDA